MDSFNNMKKTVLKLENEINAIGLNLTKVKKKEHSKMKNIIHNINKLLIKDSDKNNIHSNKVDKYLYDMKEKNKKDNNINNNNNKYVHSKNNDIDCILISLKNQKNKNDNELNLNDETSFNKNRKASSRIYINKNIQNNLISNEKILNINESEYENYKANTLTNKLNNKNINKSRNKNNLFYTHMTYSKPKLNNDFSKNNIKRKRQKTKSSEQVINKIFDINNKVDSLFQIEDKSDSTSNLKNSTSNRKPKSKQIKEKNNNENLNILNNVFTNMKKKSDEKSFKKEMLYNRNVFENNNEEIDENSKNNGGYFQIPETSANINKDKNDIFELKSEEKKIKNVNKNSVKNPLLFNKKKYINTFRNRENLLNNNHTDIAYLIKKEENKNCIKSFEDMNAKLNDEDLILKTINVQKNKTINMNKRNYRESRKETDTEENNIKVTKLLNMLNANDINDAISKVAKLTKLQKYINKCKQIYFEDNNNINNSKNNEEKNKNFQWFSEMIKNYKKNKIYKNFCETIMVNNKLNHFDDFKKFINNILINNKKSNGFLVEVKNILLEDGYYANQKKGRSVNKINYENNIKNIKKTNNKTFYDLENSNDIKFSRQDDNFEIKENWTKTYY